VEFLAGLARDGRVLELELAIGTGRVALPLAARGIAVEGVDASAAMVERLRAKPGGDSIPSPWATWPKCRSAAGSGWCIWCSARCSACSARRGRQSASATWRVLDPGGMFVVECFVPDLTRFDHDQRVQARTVTEGSAIIEVSRHDRVQQRVNTQMITLDGQGMHLRPVAIRYSWPAELDLMADRAGLLTERHADWDRRPFTSASDGHVSVYQRT
jgi:SAM-dependent methyltransferase